MTKAIKLPFYYYIARQQIVDGARSGAFLKTSGETFVLIVPEALRVLTFQPSQIGMVATVTAYGVGTKEDPPQVSRIVSA